MATNHSPDSLPSTVGYNMSFTFPGIPPHLQYPPDDLYPWVTDDIIGEVRRSFFMYKNPPTAVLIGLYAITCLIGLVGNVMVLYVFARNRHMRTPTNAFLGNLAVCDLMVVCMCMPFAIAIEVYYNWIYGDIMCKVVNFVQGLSVTSSILTLAVISAERFYAIKCPFKARTFQSKKRIYKIIGVIWFSSAILVLPVVFVRRQKETEKILTISLCACVEHWPFRWMKHLYNFTLLFLLYLGPVLFIVVGYLHIGLNLWRHDSLLHVNRSGRPSDGMRHALTGRRRVAKMLFVMALLFAVSWLPMHIMSIMLDYLPEEYYKDRGLVLRQVYSYLVWLAHANSSVNPVCYCIMSQSFKSTTMLELKQCCRRRVEWRRPSFASLTLNSSNSSSKWSNGRTSRTYTYRSTGRQSWANITMAPCKLDRSTICAV